MSVFLNCLLRAKNLLTGGGYDPPDCCGDFNGDGPDDPIDDGDESCNPSEAGYSYCTRSTQDETGTTKIVSFSVTFQELLDNGIVTEDDCTGAGNTYTNWPLQIGPGATGDRVHDYILAVYMPVGHGAPARLGGIDASECTTFDCNAIECVDATVECPLDGCQTITYKTDIFKCSEFMPPGACYNGCDNYFFANPLIDPLFETYEECRAKPCCDDSGGGGGGSGPTTPTPTSPRPTSPQAPCYLFKCNQVTNECDRVEKTPLEWFTELGITTTVVNPSCQTLFAQIQGQSYDAPNGITYYKSKFTCDSECGPPPPPECELDVCKFFGTPLAQCGTESKTASEWAAFFNFTGSYDCAGIIQQVSNGGGIQVGVNKYMAPGSCGPTNCYPTNPPGTGIDPGDIDGGTRPINGYIFCNLWYCDGEVPKKVSPTLSLLEIINQLGPPVASNSTNCNDLPPIFTGSDGVVYATSPGNLVCEGPGGGGGAGPFTPPGGTAGGSLFGGDVGGGGGGGAPNQQGGLGSALDDEPAPPGNLGGFQTGIDLGGGDTGGGGAGPFTPPGGVAGGTNVGGFGGGSTGIGDPGGTAGGTNVGGFGGGSTPIDGPGGVSNGGIFNDGPGDSGGPNAAGGLGGFDFEGPSPPGNLGGFQTGIDLGGGDTGGGGGGAPGGGTVIDPPTGVADPGQPFNFPTGSRTISTSQGSIRREFLKSRALRATDPDLTNLNYRRTKRFIPEKNVSYRKDLFAPIVHYALESIRQIESKVVNATDLPFGELSLENIQQSLHFKIREKMEKLRPSVMGDKIRRQILSYIKRKIIQGDTESISIVEINSILDNFNDPEVLPNRHRVTEAGAVEHAISEGIPLDPNKYGSEINKEQMRLWKTVATDLDKHLTVLFSDGSQDKIFIDKTDSFDLTLSDGTTSSAYISPGDVYWTANAGNIPIQYDRDRVMALNFKDIDKVFHLLNQENSIVLNVSSAENENFLVEKDSDLESARPEAYVLRLDPESIEDLERDHDLIRISQARYYLMDYSEIDEWMSFNPFPFNTFYIDNEDPFLDHLERDQSLFGTFKDFSLDSYFGYNDNMPIFPRRLPWTVAIIPTDREELQTGSSRSEFVSLTERKIVFKRNLVRTRNSLDNPILDLSVVGYGQGAIPDAPTDNQVQFRFNINKVIDQIRPYKNEKESLPRKASPIRSLLTALESTNVEENYIDSRKAIVPWPVVLKNMSVADRKLLIEEVTDYNKFRSRVSLNKLATKENVKALFPKLSSVPIQDNDIKIDNYTPPPKKVTRLDGNDYRAETPEPLP